MLHEAITKDVIGDAMTVLNTLKRGLDEKFHERALVIEPGKRGLMVDQQKPFLVRNDRVETEAVIPDPIIDEWVVVDKKSVSDFSDTHIARMPGYLNITGLKLAILLNFKHTDVRWKGGVR